MRVLSIDQGTTNTKALIIDDAGEILARASCPTSTHYPQPGWVEQSATEIWQATRSAIDTVVKKIGADQIDAVSIANQRETFIMWDARDSKPVAPAIVWQCRRTAQDCAALVKAGHDPTVKNATGLGINPLFPASKLAWLLRESEEARSLLKSGNLRTGTVDTWLLWNLTGGKSFATDHSNASRTQLFDTEKMAWSHELADIFGATTSCLAEALPSDHRFGETAPDVCALPGGIPIHAMMGDSHAALFGHGVRKAGDVKATFGTGSSVMMLTPQRVRSDRGLSGTIAWTNRNGIAYALEGNITVSGQASTFMAGLLGLKSPQELSDLAQGVETSDGAVFVPALAGLGAPHWADNATGIITGMTHGTTPAHLARAVMEAIAFQVADVVDAMASDAQIPISELRADGGATANSFLMQLQANILNRNVAVSSVEEVGAIGAAAMAFSAMGTTLCLSSSQKVFESACSDLIRNKMRKNWQKALRQCLTS